MDYISSIEIVSWRHFHFNNSVSFKPGVNLLLGKNGSGKTSLLRMIQAAAMQDHYALSSEINVEYPEGSRLVSIVLNTANAPISVVAENRGGTGRWTVNDLRERLRFITSARSVNSGTRAANPFASHLNLETGNIGTGEAIDVAEEFNKAIIKELVDIVKKAMSGGTDFLKELQDSYQAGLIDFEKTLNIDPSKENAVTFIDHLQREVPINDLSSGEKEYLYFYAYLRRIANDVDKIILIDEPELHLHSSQIRKLCELISNLAIKNQIVIATHSGEVLQHFISTANLMLLSKSSFEHIDNSDQMRKILEETGLPIDPSVFTARWICAENEPSSTLSGNGPTTPEALAWIFGNDLSRRYWSFGSNRAVAAGYSSGVASAISSTTNIKVTAVLDGDQQVKNAASYVPTATEPTENLAYFPFWELENIFLKSDLLDVVIPTRDGIGGAEQFWAKVTERKDSLILSIKKTVLKNSMRQYSADRHVESEADVEAWKASVQQADTDLSPIDAVFESVVSNRDWKWIPGKEALPIALELSPGFWKEIRELHLSGKLKPVIDSDSETRSFIEKICALS